MTETDNGNGGTVKIGTVKWIGSMLLAALVSYFGTTFGMQARIDSLEKANAQQPGQLSALTNEVQALNRQMAVLTAIVERVEARQNAGRR